MRKIIAVLFFTLLTSCALLPREEKFVNPIFYETILGKKQIRLTPTQYYVENQYGYHTSAKCEMLENLEDRITLKCLFMPADPNNEEELIIVSSNEKPLYMIKTYIIMPNLQDGKYTIEEQTYFDENKRGLAHTYYHVNPDKKL